MHNKEKEVRIGSDQVETSAVAPPVLPNKNFELVSVIKILAILILLLLVGIGVSIYAFKSEDKVVKAVANVVPYPLAMVDYQLINLSDYWRELDVVLNACEQIGTDCQISAQDRKQVTDGLIREKVVEKLTKQYAISLTSEELDEEFNRIVEENGGEEVFFSLLEEQFNWTADELKERIRLDMLMRKLQDEKIEQVQASHILVMFAQGATDEDKNSAKEKAQAALDRINNGEDFATVAKEVSEDPGSAENGGDLGFFTRGVMVTEFENAAFGLSAGQVSDLIQTQYGWHIIKVTDKKNEIQMGLNDWLQSEQDKMKVWIFYNKE